MTTTETEGTVAESTPIDSTQPANQVSLPRWAELKRAYVARQGKEHGASAKGAADPDPIAPEH
ncbi:hypothetical protein QMG61_05755 [Cryobacterium sp. PH31-AA6]|uniref:hypothetical protein n=1 Tax=Cryobacterium sp. PH31-AA6 TaxID=3046205 RepID=UPI0024BBC632|nr:hypothetical protein [Cryobacterium sp. PH31-AA6]MDJ0323267.1 hypothetical protein [Cryobacterium sp. PH31-AA6]